jgi:flavin reductase
MPNQEDIAKAFGGVIPTEDRFSFGHWDDGMTGSPVLLGASVSLECELVNAVDQATHRVMFGRVIGIRENEERSALLY